MSDISECSNCFEDFKDEPEYLPKIMKCGDTFCVKCIKTFIVDNKIICPICNTIIMENIDEMPINKYALNQKKSLFCDICLEEFSNNLSSEKIPRILKCGDTFCTQCLNKLRSNDKLIYSFCSKECYEEVEKLSINKYVIEECEKKRLFNFQYLNEKEIGINKLEYKFQIGLIGETNSGKTSIIHYFYSGKPLNARLITSIGLESNYKYFSDQYRSISITLLDTAGQQRFSTMSARSLSRIQALLLVFSLTKNFDEIERQEYNNAQEEVKEKLQKDYTLKAFNNARFWLNKFLSFNKQEKIIIYLIGNKCDDVKNRIIKTEDAKCFAKENNFKYKKLRNKSPLISEKNNFRGFLLFNKNE